MHALVPFLLALAWDLTLGEPPAKLHPVVWFGRIAGFIDSRYKRRSPVLDFTAGLLTALVVITFAFLLSIVPFYAPFPLNYFLAAYLLKSSFAIKSLHEHVSRTITDDIEEKRRAVSMIVSRNTKVLDEAHLNSAAIESLAENLNDSVVAPLFYFLLFGLQGAVIYRAVNTLDAMLGYRNERYEFFGKFSARLDDALNFIPARLTVLLYLPLGGRKVPEYYRLARFKINSDKPMAAMSAVLGVWLEKPGVYRFPGKEPKNEDIKRALRIYWLVVTGWVIVVVLLLATGVCPCLSL
ncbi:cobinamide synthase [Thermococcus kodakarensis KOD1]|uniref:Probable cobalamin biosynthesis protein CobD n=1 Tax=Thermococcus kodakarensis (strain ATCC BAA-918 / JCM 12380 / KOD1) TaxID=69014 RepID=COBD_THEKO|nr:adenosylcobinamide-phosphate synthase CbiB [Thermococcus kodakarensis]Q5JI24.1 RecName: Full=Probable cobalamin biosynthesis protein CobD [Thermococcus kodakarensis KOD1]WCN28863.1 adenosylcobinamide-phosphate synthase CbiB [Thermococcus kodakarensis]WCN31166.1 adenosylcobinamide-phosphate synthase CbiB [Thermococcus kodakarensis]BAD85052.1 cobinamide synthase [Thermococcus kodakarensis KOD1]